MAQLKQRVTAHDWRMDRILSNVRLPAHYGTVTFTPGIIKPSSRQVWRMRQETFRANLVYLLWPWTLQRRAALKIPAVGKLRVFKNVISNAQMS